MIFQRFFILRNGSEICVHYGVEFLFVFKACPVLDAGAKKQAHSELCNCFCNTEDEQKDKSESTSYKTPAPKLT